MTEAGVVPRSGETIPQTRAYSGLQYIWSDSINARMKAYSVDLRQKIVEAVSTGSPKAQVARAFGIAAVLGTGQASGSATAQA